jgi:hypothetical protein
MGLMTQQTTKTGESGRRKINQEAHMKKHRNYVQNSTMELVGQGGLLGGDI